MFQKKVRHFDIPDQAHLLTFSCFHRWPLLSKDRSRLWFIESLSEARVACAFDLWAWVVMPEHVHLLILPRMPVYSTASILSEIKRPVGVKAIQYLRKHGPTFLKRLEVVNRHRTYHHFWQPGPGHDNNLWEPISIHRAIEYIHMNPVRRGLVRRAEDWSWSSAADWADVGCPLIRVDRTVPMMHQWVR